ncbi:MAG: hypothetical protein AVDCRST_MAG86-17 [uncultured Truepera sp.]|uniref:DUF4386 domain-containing protein n=1 Tax=uncultured Truepera sp. TaxID=543023 RepID=A0A6J4UMT1_9DEIN|nr:MAG: hypothetical protein AVDCRST_MAG86-17 [uncultured Truepera sp.]
MSHLQRLGGVAALINAAAYIVGIGLALTLLAPVLDSSPEQYLTFLADNQTLLYLWHLIIYLVAGVFMVPLVLAVHERLKASSPALMQIATAFGLIWAVTIIGSGMIIVNNVGVVADLYGQDPAQAATVLAALSAVEEGLGGAVELPGGLWILLISWAALRTGGFPKLLSTLGLAIGAAGLLTVIPALYEAGTVFGLGFIAWFIWVGVVLLRGGSSAPYLPRPQRGNLEGNS